MRLSRIIMALTVGLAVVAVPTAAGAAQPQPRRSATTDAPAAAYSPQPGADRQPADDPPRRDGHPPGTGFGPNEPSTSR